MEKQTKKWNFLLVVKYGLKSTNQDGLMQSKRPKAMKPSRLG
jgi:hypothetical protein